ncbi:MAG: asparaginase [Halomonas sp.]|nr:asparaginase [Halomonas sp.]MDN6297359.1 asparaginase [Halomonas sp.]MDN6314112.1 asparaginase [Halomonas sp.]MDN6335344.1 asparaginase [Halomonas sp.]
MRLSANTTLPVLIIYTGGTIGMQTGPQGLTPGGDFATRMQCALATLPAGKRQLLPDVDVISYSPLIDSSATTPLDWQTLADDIRARHADYAGVVVVHGTDTLSWTASSLAFQLRELERPIIVTGAMHPLETPGSDALDNLYGALRFAMEPAPAGVAVYFAGRLLHGARATKQHASANDAFISPNAPPLGECLNGPLARKPLAPAVKEVLPTDHTPADYRRVAQGEVIRIALWPGMAAWQLDAWLNDSRVKGALLQLWGAGNMADDPALIDVLKQANDQGKLIAAVSQCPHGSVDMSAYAAAQGLVQAGVLSGADMTPEAAYTKLVHLLALPLDNATRRAAFMTSLAGERSDG